VTRAIRALAASLAVLCAAVVFIAVLSSIAARGSTRMKWILNTPAAVALAADPTAQRFFANSAPFVVRRKDDTTILPPSWRATITRTFTSYAAMKLAFASGGIGDNVRAILYDNVHWQFTPDEEQRGHAQFTRMAAQLVHQHGLLFLAAPAVNLTQVLAPGPEKRYDAYLRVGIARDAARYADVFEIQAQGSEKEVDKYASFVRAAAGQAREANPKVLVLAGISTNPSGLSVTADDVLAAISATRASVDGYWFNIPRQSQYCPRCGDFRPDIAIDVLKRLGAGGR